MAKTQTAKPKQRRERRTEPAASIGSDYRKTTLALSAIAAFSLISPLIKLLWDAFSGSLKAGWLTDFLGQWLALTVVLVVYAVEEDMASPDRLVGRCGQFVFATAGGAAAAGLLAGHWSAAWKGALAGALLALLMRWLKYPLRHWSG